MFQTWSKQLENEDMGHWIRRFLFFESENTFFSEKWIL
jgi:hypothetical protein